MSPHSIHISSKLIQCPHTIYRLVLNHHSIPTPSRHQTLITHYVPNLSTEHALIITLFPHSVHIKPQSAVPLYSVYTRLQSPHCSHTQYTSCLHNHSVPTLSRHNASISSVPTPCTHHVSITTVSHTQCTSCLNHHNAPTPCTHHASITRVSQHSVDIRTWHSKQNLHQWFIRKG